MNVLSGHRIGDAAPADELGRRSIGLVPPVVALNVLAQAAADDLSENRFGVALVGPK